MDIQTEFSPTTDSAIASEIKGSFLKFPKSITDQAIASFVKSKESFLKQIAPKPELYKILKEWGIAWLLAQQVPNWRELANDNKPVLMDNKSLRLRGIDPARIVRFLILEHSYPKGIDLNSKQITLVLQQQDFDLLIEIIKRTIPDYNNLNHDQFNNLIAKLGFSLNEPAGNYVNRLTNDKFAQLILNITNTQSVPPQK